MSLQLPTPISSTPTSRASKMYRAGPMMLSPAFRGLSPDERCVVGATRQVATTGIDAVLLAPTFAERCGMAGAPGV